MARGILTMRQVGTLGLAILLVAASRPSTAQESRTGMATIDSMTREFGTFGDMVYQLRLTAKGAKVGVYSVTASKTGAPCDGFIVGDDEIPTVYTASTVTLTKGKNVCRLNIRRMF